MAKLTPHIYSEDARTQAEFYKNALGGDIPFAMTFGQFPGADEATKDKIMHLRLDVAGGNEIFFADSVVEPANRGNVSLTLDFDTETEAKEAFSNLSVGGNVVFPFDLQPWGAYYGEIKDKFGITWQILKQNQ